MSHARDRPKNHYSVEDNGDGTVDVYLSPDFCVYKTEDGAIEYERKATRPPEADTLSRPNGAGWRVSNCKFEPCHRTLYVMRGVEKFDGIEEDIRRRYYSWLESAERLEI